MVAAANRRVLVLNKNWMALRVVSLDKAVKYLTKTTKNGQPKARIIDTDDLQQYTWDDWSKMRPVEGEDAIVGVSLNYRVPSVIRLEHYDKIPNHKISFNRKTIYRRDCYTCQYCGGRPGTEELSIDHIIPKSQGGKSTWDNCVLACVKCNARKADKSLAQAKMKLLKEPTKPTSNFFKGEIICKTWRQFFEASYWTVELQNDN